MRTLIQDVRSEQNIFAAWRHVKKSALASQNNEIRGAASEFEHAHQRHLRRIVAQLREGRFVFDPVKGVLKDARKRIAIGKDPRPIAIATLKNRIVQRAILQVLQPRKVLDLTEREAKFETSLDDRLGRINDINRSRFGVGGLLYPYGGVAPAIKTIRAAIDAGATHYYQSDIRAFFTKIPTDKVVEFIRTETNDDALANLFEEGLVVHLENEEELQGYSKLFPRNGIGVAQGSSLSALSGNILLYELDHKLNSMGVTAVRYIDDILMVGRDEVKLNAAIEYATKQLNSFGFGLYLPEKGSEKAARGMCRDSINFLGCTIQPNRCVPSAVSIRNLKEGISKSLSDSKAAIKEAVRTGTPPSPKLSRTATLDAIGKRIYGWQKAFAFSTDPQPFKQIDDFLIAQALGYEASVRRIVSRSDPAIQLSVLGIPCTYEMFLL